MSLTIILVISAMIYGIKSISISYEGESSDFLAEDCSVANFAAYFDLDATFQMWLVGSSNGNPLFPTPDGTFINLDISCSYELFIGDNNYCDCESELEPSLTYDLDLLNDWYNEFEDKPPVAIRTGNIVYLNAAIRHSNTDKIGKLFILPEGFRPLRQTQVRIPNRDSINGNAVIRVKTNGVVLIIERNGSEEGDEDINLDAVSFVAA